MNLSRTLVKLFTTWLHALLAYLTAKEQSTEVISQSVLGANGWLLGELFFPPREYFFPLEIRGILPSQKHRYIFLGEIRSILKIHYFREQKLLLMIWIDLNRLEDGANKNHTRFNGHDASRTAEVGTARLWSRSVRGPWGSCWAVSHTSQQHMQCTQFFKYHEAKQMGVSFML